MLYSILSTITELPKNIFIDKQVKLIPLEKMYYSVNPFTTAIRKASGTLSCSAVSQQSGTAFFTCTVASGGGVLRKYEPIEILRSGVKVCEATVVSNTATEIVILPTTETAYSPENSDTIKYFADSVVDPDTNNSVIFFKADKSIFLLTDASSPTAENLIIKPFFFE